MYNRLISLGPYSDNRELERKRLEETWDKIVLHKNYYPNDLNIRPAMMQSWKRCLDQGVDPVYTKAPIISSDQQVKEQFLNSHLYRLLLPYLKEMVMETDNLLVITNAKGEINHIDGDFSLQCKAEKMNFVVGSSWAERDTGTNAIGTVLATKKPVQVFAAEHFSQKVHEWSCSAAPIIEPVTREILGVIDLTSLWKRMHPSTLSVVLTIARAIENDLRKDLEVNRYKLLAHYLEITKRTPNIPIVALDYGGTVLKADPMLYENQLINENNVMKDVSLKIWQQTSEESWEVETKNGRWKFISIPYIEQGRTIGTIVHAMPPSSVGVKVSCSSVKHSFCSMIGQSKTFTISKKEAIYAAGTDLPVLIEGESGTGKELFAQSIHAASLRATKPFIAVNCGALPKDLAVSELFGFEDGSFTGAAKGGRPGKFKQAQGGTIFLDEIGEMPLDMQTYLLRVLEEGEVVPLGAQKPIRLDVRVIAATNRDLLTAVDEGRFRRDLYYRLNILCIHVPPLRKRVDDIPLLIEFHLKKACREIGRSPIKIHESTTHLLQEYKWSGNVRELRNIVYRMATNTPGSVLEVSDLPYEIRSSIAHENNIRETPIKKSEQYSENQFYETKMFKETTIKDQELEMILTVLDKLNGNVTEAARRLGIHRSTIYRKLRTLQGYKNVK
jgi:transcriptional regulator of acetoin/glycerol metabolism